jgi:hypothetical protein
MVKSRAQKQMVELRKEKKQVDGNERQLPTHLVR